MSEAFESIKQGLTEAIEYNEGKPGKAIIYEFTPVDGKAVRKKDNSTTIYPSRRIGNKS